MLAISHFISVKTQHRDSSPTSPGDNASLFLLPATPVPQSKASGFLLMRRPVVRILPLRAGDIFANARNQRCLSSIH